MFRIITEGPSYSEYVLLKNGQGLLFRAFHPEDKNLVKEFMSRISQESLRMRFMASVSVVSDEMISMLCDGDFRTDGCIVAITGEGEKRKVVGIGNYNGAGNGRSAEVSFLIEDDYQGLGISALLLERLAGLAAANGYIEFEAEVLPENQSMIHVFKNSGFENHQVWHSDTVHIEFPVSGAAGLWKRANLREKLSVANSLKPVLHPHSIAVVGASRDDKSIGHLIFKNILNGQFTGTVYPINPQANSVNGVKAFSSLKELPEKIDLAVIAVPAEKVYEAAESAVAAGAKGLIVVSAGFAEAGEEGKRRQEKLLEFVRANGVRLVGPSCLGVMNTAPEVKLNASLARRIMEPGSAAFFSHSAALGLVILNYAEEIGVKFSTFVSAGNRADVSGNDLLQYWEEDPNTKMVILYLETFGNPRRFTRIARRMSYKKPILCVKSARSKIGKQTAEAKTAGTASGEAGKVEALFVQTGVILADTLEELFDVALVLSSQPLPKGNRVAVIANSAGMATIFADSSESNGLRLADNGLVDLGAFTSAENYESAVKNLLAREDVDSILIGYACVGECTSEPVSAAIKKGVEEAEKITGVSKPALLCLMGKTGAVSLTEEDNKKVFPAFRFPEGAARALGKIARYSAFKNLSAGKLIWFDDVKADEARKFVHDLLSGKTNIEIVELKTGETVSLLEKFNLKVYDDNFDSEKELTFSVTPDPLFGPLIRIEKFSGETIIRITPLTDSDIEETAEELNCEKKTCIKEILGRVSQMIEEIPWLWELKFEIIIDDDEMKITGPEIFLKAGAVYRPSY